MAPKPAAAMSAPPAADDDETGADAGADTGATEDDETDDEEGDQDEGDEVLVTICRGENGGYTIYAGDEDEEDEPGKGDEDNETENGGGDQPADGSDKDEGQPAESIGAALKLVMDILKKDEAESSGEGSTEDNFSQGFAGGSSASAMPSKPAAPMAQKY